jgi:hypothetical protein
VQNINRKKFFLINLFSVKILMSTFPTFSFKTSKDEIVDNLEIRKAMLLMGPISPGAGQQMINVGATIMSGSVYSNIGTPITTTGTLPAQKIISGFVEVNTTAGNVTLTLDTAPNVIGLLPIPVTAGQKFSVTFLNIGSANTLTIALGSGMTNYTSALTVASGASATFTFIVANSTTLWVLNR